MARDHDVVSWLVWLELVLRLVQIELGLDYSEYLFPAPYRLNAGVAAVEL